MAGLPPIGCLPMQVTLGSIIPSFHMLQRVCVNQQNFDSQAYNNKLQTLTSRLQAQHHRAKVLYVDIYNPMMDMIMNPHKYGKLYISAALRNVLLPLVAVVLFHSKRCVVVARKYGHELGYGFSPNIM